MLIHCVSRVEAERKTESMYAIKIHNFVLKILQTFYQLKLWDVTEKTSFRTSVLKILQLLYFASFVASMAGGAYMSISTDKDECIFLTVASMINGVIVYRMANIIWKKKEILSFTRDLCEHSMQNREQFSQVNKKLENFIRFAKAFVWMCVIGVTFALCVPMFSSEKKLVFNIALPSHWKSNDIIFWTVHLYSVLACSYSSHALLLCIIIWYLMLNGSIKFMNMGNQLRNLGVQKERFSEDQKEKLFVRDLIEIIKCHLKMNNTINRFASCFGKLFLLQIYSSGICICGSIYTLAFSSDRNFLQNGIYCVFIAYSFFDIFTLMYLGNELKLSRDQLTYCLFESNWIEQPNRSKKYILILAEVIQQPREIMVGKIYPLNLKTFTKILNGAYSMFNILKTLN